MTEKVLSVMKSLQEKLDFLPLLALPLAEGRLLLDADYSCLRRFSECVLLAEEPDKMTELIRHWFHSLASAES